MNNTFLVLILLSLSVPVFSDWTCFDTSCYLVVQSGKSWSDAQTDCISRGGNLASIHSQDEQAFIESLIYFHVWIGASDITTEGNYIWTDGTDFNFTDWIPEHPNGGTSENCVQTVTNLSKKWNDAVCSLAFSYICKQNKCLSSPCRNGTCQAEFNGFRCLCFPGYTGTNCDMEISNECMASPCINGDCQDLINGFRCICIPGFTGTLCDLDINECLSSPCTHGSCQDKINGFGCTCIPGFTGTLCDLEINECDYNYCFHGNCTDQLNNYTCKCHPGYTGYNCEQNINECESSPCVYGICEDLVDAFMCSCNPGYFGVYCQHDHIVPIVVPLFLLALVLLSVVTGLAIALRISRKRINMKKNAVQHFSVSSKDGE